MILAVLLAAAAPMCLPRQLSLSTDGRDGDFNGMSHSGTLLVLRNRGARACRLAGLPKVTFRDARGRPLPIMRRIPPGMHPGPVIVPVTIARYRRATTALHWVSGPVYDRNRCYDPALVSVDLAGGRVTTRLAAHICGPASGVTFEQPVLAASR